MTVAKKHLTADPRRASAIIAHISKPGNRGISNKQAARDLGTNEAYVRRAKAVYDWGDTTEIDPNVIRRDGSTQSRATINNETIADYSEAISNGVILPPIKVFYDGSDYWLADGFHRVLAALHARRKMIEAVVTMGGRRDAILYSVGANDTNGLRRTNEDKRRAVTMLLTDEEWSQRSDRNIAEQCKVSNRFVSDIRGELASVNGSQMDEVRLCTRNGMTYPISIANKRRKVEPTSQSTEALRPQPAPPIPTFDPFDDIAVIDSGPMPECLRNPDPSPLVREDARRDAIRTIRAEWPELADALDGPRGRLVTPDTLDMIVRDLFRTHQD